MMQIGRIILRPADCALLRIADWWGCHTVMNRMFRAEKPAELLWHCEGRMPEGLSFLVLTNRDPVIPAGTGPFISMKPFPESALPSEGRFAFQVRFSGRRWAAADPGGLSDAGAASVRTGRNGKTYRQRDLTESEVMTAFEKRSADWGMRIEKLVHEGTQKALFPHERSTMAFRMHDLAGEFELVDPARFRRAAFGGIGARLSFGCGLLRYGRI